MTRVIGKPVSKSKGQGSNWTGTHRNGVPVHFLEIPNKIQIAFVAWISLLPSLAILKLRLSIGLLAFVTVLY